MITKDTLRLSGTIAVATLIMALTAIFGKFQALIVAGDQLNLSSVLLAVIFIGTGYATGAKASKRGILPVLLNGVIGAVIVGAALLVLIFFESRIDLTFVFPDLKTNPLAPVLLFGQAFVPGFILLIVFSAVGGLIGALLHRLDVLLRNVLLTSIGMTVVIGLLAHQINNIITLPDSLSLFLVFCMAYLLASRLSAMRLLARVSTGIVFGAVVGIILGLIANNGGLESGGILRGAGNVPSVLGLSPGSAVVPLIIVFAVVASLGIIAASAPSIVHNGSLYVAGVVLLLGILNWQANMTYLASVIVFVLLFVMLRFVPSVGKQSETRYEELNPVQQQWTGRLAAAGAVLIIIVAPMFLGQYITSVLDLVGLYVIMGIGLNVVVGYAGLLDLGYVAFFALGAYTIGLLTTPSLLTCGGISPKEIPVKEIQTVCTGMMTFWQAWPFSVLVAGLAGVLLGIPVLRLRGDYLAIVTLGFGEIIRLIILSNDFKPLLGAAQGITKIPGPVLDLSFLNARWRLELGNALNIYYLIFAAVLLAALIAIRLGGTRLGRAWRAMRADEDVAQAMGVNLVRTKLLAFAVGAAFAGMGGAIFGSWLKGIFPNSFTLSVSINVLSLIIIGGLGSVPGVILGALMLLGLPEVLRELQDYRLLAFGILLVITMLAKPEGLIPPSIRRLSQRAEEYQAKESLQHE